MKKKWVIALIVVLVIVWLLSIGNEVTQNDNGKTKILTSFYPIYVMTLNVTKNTPNVEVTNMAENLRGCIHDYSLTTADLKKFEKCNVFIQNGNGLENFTDKIVESYPDVKVISASANLKDEDYIKDGDETNSHIWLDLNNYISEVNTIKDELTKINPENAEIYEKNASSYIESLDTLKSKYDTLFFENQKCVLLNESLSYLLNEINFKNILIESDHEQSSVSAETIKNTIDQMKNEDIKIIIIDENDSKKVAETLASETGAQIITLNSGMNGQASLDAYLEIMESNYKILDGIQTAQRSESQDNVNTIVTNEVLEN